MKMENEKSFEWFTIIRILLDNLFIKLLVYTGIGISILIFFDSLMLLRIADYSILPLNILIINVIGFPFLAMMMGYNLDNGILDIFEIKPKTKIEKNIDSILYLLVILITGIIVINWMRVF